MKKLMFLGLILTLFSIAVSAQQASDESFRRHRTERNSEFSDRHGSDREQRMQMGKHKRYHDGRISRRERHRIHRMHRHERREFHRSRHHRHHHAY